MVWLSADPSQVYPMQNPNMGKNCKIRNPKYKVQSAIFQSPCACAAERLKRRPKPWIKKTFGGSSQNRYTFSICATLPSISSVNLVHFRFVVHFTDLCKSKNDGPDRQRKHHNCKKGPETPKKTLTKNINSMYRPIGEQTLESTEGGTT